MKHMNKFSLLLLAVLIPQTSFAASLKLGTLNLLKASQEQIAANYQPEDLGEVIGDDGILKIAREGDLSQKEGTAEALLGYCGAIYGSGFIDSQCTRIDALIEEGGGVLSAEAKAEYLDAQSGDGGDLYVEAIDSGDAELRLAEDASEKAGIVGYISTAKDMLAAVFENNNLPFVSFKQDLPETQTRGVANITALDADGNVIAGFSYLISQDEYDKGEVAVKFVSAAHKALVAKAASFNVEVSKEADNGEIVINSLLVGKNSLLASKQAILPKVDEASTSAAESVAMAENYGMKFSPGKVAGGLELISKDKWNDKILANKNYKLLVGMISAGDWGDEYGVDADADAEFHDYIFNQEPDYYLECMNNLIGLINNFADYRETFVSIQKGEDGFSQEDMVNWGMSGRTIVNQGLYNLLFGLYTPSSWFDVKDPDDAEAAETEEGGEDVIELVSLAG